MVGKVTMTPDNTDEILAAMTEQQRAELDEASEAWWREHTRSRVVRKLRCRARGCLEVVAYLDFERWKDRRLEFQLTWYAPTLRPTVDEPGVLLRVMLTGSQDPDNILPTGWIIPDHWPRGACVEFGCRMGHVSRFGASEMAALLRRAR